MMRFTLPRQRPGSSRRGASLVEMGPVLLIFCTMIFGTIEFADYFCVKNAFEAASREGARAGIPPNAVNADVTSAVLASVASAGYSTKNVAVAVTDEAGAPVDVTSAPIGSAIQVTVSVPWSAISSGYCPYHLIDGSKHVSGVCIMHKAG